MARLGLARLGLALGLALLLPLSAHADDTPLPLPDPIILSTEAQAWLLPAAESKGVVLMLHGCGGMLTGAGKPIARFRDYVPRVLAQGYSVMLVDSFTLRGRREICTQAMRDRWIKVKHRAEDVRLALDWLAQAPATQALGVTLLGWSNGGSTLLDALQIVGTRPNLHRAVAFYPGCEIALRKAYGVPVPLLVMTGREDDWTPAAPCRAWSAGFPDRVAYVEYEGAYHGFDSVSPLQLRKDVPGGVNPGRASRWAPTPRHARIPNGDCLRSWGVRPKAQPSGG
ncbi:MAG: hypothetical protein RLY30_1596 [Pseudomonadota bacterium]